MAAEGSYAREILERLRQFREEAGLSQGQVEAEFLLGPGWMQRFESGKTPPTLDLILLLVNRYHKTPDDLFLKTDFRNLPTIIKRFIYAIPNGDGLLIHFQYASHDAAFRLADANLEQYDQIIKIMRDGLARLAPLDATTEEVEGNSKKEEKERITAIKADSVAKTFLKAVEIWPSTNPSDLWWFVVQRAYFDPFNHPASFARLDLGQSWKRTGGWALEIVLVRHYGPYLARHGIELFIARGKEKAALAGGFVVRDHRLVADKIDVLLAGSDEGRRVVFGVVHVKASFAERRTDDVPLSEALVKAGYTSPLWTMDSKSTPADMPHNKGELGSAYKVAEEVQGIKARGRRGPNATDPRNDKRKDIEDDAKFSACFSYNVNTVPTPETFDAKARVLVCNFNDPDDAFSKFILESWDTFKLKASF